MKKSTQLLLLLLSLAASLRAAEHAVVTVTHTLDLARPSETIAVPWTQIEKALPGALLQHLVVRDAAGDSLPYQVTNIAPEAKDPHNLGVAYGDLLFQHDFAAGEKSATFVIERLEAVAPVFPAQVFARYVPERLDDFAWENDRIGHRTFGPALAAPDTAQTGKEVLVTSGLDVWCKRVPYLIVDRWYNKGHDHYHKDEGEGMDMYNVGASRGCGGTGIWDGKNLAVGRNYQTWKVIANGPIRAIFELGYDAWDAAGGKVAEVKRFTVDAGHNLDLIESTFTVPAGGPAELTVGIGLNKNPCDRGQDPVIENLPVAADGAITQCLTQKTHGMLGNAIIVPSAAFAGFAEDATNELVLAKATPGRPLAYLVGAGWSAAGEFKTPQAWKDYVAACAARARAPVQVTVTTAP